MTSEKDGTGEGFALRTSERDLHQYIDMAEATLAGGASLVLVAGMALDLRDALNRLHAPSPDPHGAQATGGERTRHHIDETNRDRLVRIRQQMLQHGGVDSDDMEWMADCTGAYYLSSRSLGQATAADPLTLQAIMQAFARNPNYEPTPEETAGLSDHLRGVAEGWKLRGAAEAEGVRDAEVKAEGIKAVCSHENLTHGKNHYGNDEPFTSCGMCSSQWEGHLTVAQAQSHYPGHPSKDFAQAFAAKVRP